MIDENTKQELISEHGRVAAISIGDDYIVCRPPKFAEMQRFSQKLESKTDPLTAARELVMATVVYPDRERAKAHVNGTWSMVLVPLAERVQELAGSKIESEVWGN